MRCVYMSLNVLYGCYLYYVTVIVKVGYTNEIIAQSPV